MNDSVLTLALILVLVVVSVLFFVYFSMCIVIVKQGTRKIVERFGSYRTTLSEGVHIIFVPFDRIAPVPWEVLSIQQRDEYEKQLVDSEGNEFKNVRKVENDLYNMIEADLRVKIVEKYCHVNEVSVEDAVDVNPEQIVLNMTNKNLDDLVASISEDINSTLKLRSYYSELGITLDRDLVRRVREKEALKRAIHKKYTKSEKKDLGASLATWSSKRYTKEDILDYIDLRERHIDTEYNKEFGSLKFITKDNASIRANVIIFFNVTDPYMYYYGAEEPEKSMVLLAITTLRNLVASMTLEEALGARNIINTKIRELLDSATNSWGIKANRVEIKEFNLDDKMRIAMDKVLIAEREKRAAILKAEGVARGIEIQRTAEAEGYKKIKEASLSDAVLKIRGYEALKDVADGKATKIFMPNDLSSLITGSHVFADALKDAKEENVAATVEQPVVAEVNKEE